MSARRGERVDAASVHRCNGAWLIVLNDALPEIEDATIHENCSCASALDAAKREAREMVLDKSSRYGGAVRWTEEGNDSWRLEVTLYEEEE